MSKPEKPSPFEALDAKLKAAQSRRPNSKRGGGSDRGGLPSGIGIGMRMATEIVAAIGVGVGVGLVLDGWLGTKPWLMILFLILGCGAAFMNVIRTGQEMERQAKERKEKARHDAGS
ncbi:MAG TPA: AtpZ/AtpI family protein [Kiloniellales bacterium]|nr:AtpZ/AtpI family protein [Kiloniellales bacterium]